MTSRRPARTRNSPRRAATAGALLASVLLASPAPVAQEQAEVIIRTTPVAGPIHMLEGRGGNIGVSAGPDGVLIIDDQFEELAPKIKEALAGLGSDKPRFVLNTHFHGDHTGGNAVFAEDGTIVAHENVRARLAAGTSVLGRSVPPAPAAALPVITFDESLSVHFNGERIRVRHLPRAHTDGDAIVFFTGSNVVHMGDTFFSGTFPFVDVGNGGNVGGLVAGLRALLEEIPDDARLIPGHGPLSTKKDLSAYVAMLEETSAIVESRIGEGLGRDEVIEQGLPEKWESWGGGFISTERWLGILFDSQASGKSASHAATPAGHDESRHHHD